MKAGFFSPMPPAVTGVADYSAALIAEMRKLGDVVENAAGDVNLYHIGNNHLHREIHARALAEPGVVVLHDAVLQHFYLGTLDERAYVEEFVYNYGEWSRGTAEDFWKNRARSASLARYFDYPMLRRIAESARAVIVHNPGAGALVRRHAGAVPVLEIPHLFLKPPPVPDGEIQALRSRLGIGRGVPVAGVFGHLRESKRLYAILRTMERLWAEGLEWRLVVQGDFASTDLERALASRLNDPRILRTGYLQESDFWRWARATDLCLNLRFPSAGETSGIAISMMGIGKAVVFTDGPELEHIPENACLRVEAGAAEEEHLAEILRWAWTHPEALRVIGRNAASHIEKHHEPGKVAQQFWNALRLASGVQS
jgi:glycosyltransferase involved in cell wall biosynthesis